MSNRLVEKQCQLSMDGCLLVASPSHPNPDTAHDVFLVTWHRPEGSMGMLLNRSLVADAGNLWEKVLGPEAKKMPCGPVHYGGPLEGPVIALHDRPELAEAETSPGVYIAAQVATLQKLGKSQPNTCRWIVGHAAWKSGELEKQIQEDWWYTIPASPELVFAPADEMWIRSVRRAGDHLIGLLSGCQRSPESGFWN
jgi:putative transcriptional regulator